jgi:predicted metal-dependent hydrolase
MVVLERLSNMPLPSIPVVRSRRAKRLSLRVHPVRGAWVVAPLRASQKRVDAFICTHTLWAEKALLRLRARTQVVQVSVPRGRAWRARATKTLRDRAQHFALQMGVRMNRFTLKNTRTRWGSCSSRGCIAVHEKAFFLPQELSDYIVVHELCHRVHMHHGPAFWALVAAVLPDYKARQKALTHFVV